MNRRERAELTLAQVISNQRCVICARLSDNVCGVCLELDKPACFCPNHIHLHIERQHAPNWQKLGGEEQ